MNFPIRSSEPEISQSLAGPVAEESEQGSTLWGLSRYRREFWPRGGLRLSSFVLCRRAPVCPLA